MKNLAWLLSILVTAPVFAQDNLTLWYLAQVAIDHRS